jgi:hypothetical protein
MQLGDWGNLGGAQPAGGWPAGGEGVDANGGVQHVRRRGCEGTHLPRALELIFSGGSLTVKWERREK